MDVGEVYVAVSEEIGRVDGSLSVSVAVSSMNIRVAIGKVEVAVIADVVVGNVNVTVSVGS